MKDIFESLENLNISEDCFNEIMGIAEDLISYAYAHGKGRKERAIKAAQNREMRLAVKNEMKKSGKTYQDALRKVSDRRNHWKTAAGKELLRALDSESVKDDNKEIAKDLKKRTNQIKRENKKQNKEDIINSLNSLFRNKAATDAAGSAHADAEIEQGKRNQGLSEACFNEIMDIVEDLLCESDYSVTDVKERTSNALKSRLNALKKGNQDPNSPEGQRNLSRARRAMSIMELPNSKRPFKQVQQAADNSVQSRKTAKEHNDRVNSEHEDKGFLKFLEINPIKNAEKVSKRYLKSVGLSSKKGYTHPINNTDTPIDTSGKSKAVTRDRSDDKGHKVEMTGDSHEYQNRYYQ